MQTIISWVRMTALPKMAAPVMVATGYRFDKTWRHADRGFKAFVYRNFWTVGANFAADDLEARLVKR